MNCFLFIKFFLYLQYFLIKCTNSFYQVFTAHTAKSTLFRLLFAFVVYFGWSIFQWDVIAAFMIVELAEDIYVVQSIDYFDDINWICKLNTALNDLKQSACVWEVKLVKILIEFGLIQNPIDQSVFIDEDIAVVVHVNDLFIFSKLIKTAEKLKVHIKKYVKITNLKQTKIYLNIEILRENKTLILIQRKFTQQFLNKFAFQIKIFKNLCLQGVKLEKNSAQVFCENLTLYIHLAYHDLCVIWWSVKIAVVNLIVFISIQTKIRFYDLFHHLHTLLCCNSVCDQLNTNCLITLRHKWLIVELKFNEQIFFIKDFIQWIWIFDCSITKKQKFWKKTFKNFVLIKTW